ncbi:MAG: DeoR/GlpR transcriptional regulator [Atopobiaceae bacterium]|nr:DeoR/GlpR transcriptional regulator [Atopobiaceae bacterium]
MPEQKQLLVDERRTAIMSILDRDGSVQVGELADLLNASKVTIRSDLDALDHAGKLRRTHGGAVALSRHVTVSLQDRRINVNADAKRRIGSLAATLVPDGASIFVDSGTTALELVRSLEVRNGITIITTDLTIADYVDRSLPHADVILLGGMLRKAHRYTAGPIALHVLEGLRPDISFVCPTGYALGVGLMTNYFEMGEMKRQAMHCSPLTYVLFDASKIDASCLVKFGTLDEADAIVMDRDPDGVIAAELGDASGKLLLA